MSEIKVSVLCTCFNHEKYLRQCLDSILCQKTNFDFEVIVHDDASTDESRKIIEEYADKDSRIVPILQTENKYSQGVPIGRTYMYPLVKGKYIASCECDDFWCCEDKLQRQFDFMEAHPDFSLCSHAAYYVNEDGSQIKDKFFDVFGETKELTMEELISNWAFSTNSRFFRREAYPANGIPYLGKCRSGDYAMTLYHKLQGRVFYMKDIMSAYRLNSVSSLSRLRLLDSKFHKEDRLAFLKMLDGFDEYSEKKYHECIMAYRTKCELEMYIFLGDYKTAKKMQEYKNLSKADKLRLIVKYYFPWSIKVIRKLRGLC